jgi:hypothetical protein
MSRWILASAVVAVLWLPGCGNDLGSDLRPDADGLPDGGIGRPVGGAGLPCEVRALLADHCQSCHGATPANGAPFPLVTYADLTRRNSSGVVIAQRALARMNSATSPMPPMPAPAVPAAAIASFESWVSAGAQTSAQDCGALPPGPFDGPLVCTSGASWAGGDQGSPVMHPGLACIACHTSRSGGGGDRGGDDDPPQFRIAGTVYPTGHEPNDCNGARSATVEVTDNAGRVTALAVNAAGNFSTTAAIAFPIHVAVVSNGKRRAMVSSPPVGDCNSCHTPTGANGAPGRIAAP